MLDTEDAVLIDVREPAEHWSKHIALSKLHPLSKISSEQLQDQDKVHIIYCLKGARGKKACEKLAQEQPSLKLYNIAGGIDAWEQAGLPLANTDKQILPLDRQVQISVGILLLAFSLLSTFVSSVFIWPMTLMGLGLCVAGITGFCGLGRVLAMMPWNQRVQ